MRTLSVNVDHVATLRQARGTNYPDPVIAAGICENAGADGITVHLREDRRHIQDRDVEVLRKTITTKMNLEMAATSEMVDIAIRTKPDMVTLVPENRKEITTEGGLSVMSLPQDVTDNIKRLVDNGIPVSLFIDPDIRQLESCVKLGATFIEIHTGHYCDYQEEKKKQKELERIINTAHQAVQLGLIVNAGHGIHYHNVLPLAEIKEIEEFAIGHSIIAYSLFHGLDKAVRDMRQFIFQPFQSHEGSFTNLSLKQ